MGRNLLKALTAVTTLTLAVGCAKSGDDAPSTVASKNLYVAAGLCNSGLGVTTYNATSASRAVTRWNALSGSYVDTFTDLNVGTNVSVNTVPQSLIDKGDHVLLLTENAVTMGDRKIFKIDKSNRGVYQVYANDPTAFTNTAGHVLRQMAEDADGTITFSKSIAAERVSTLGVRIAKAGANPWINPAAATGACFSGAATNIGNIAIMAPFTGMNQGKVLMAHVGATAATNTLGILARTGLTSGTAADCINGYQIDSTPHTNATSSNGPLTFAAQGVNVTSMVYIPTPAPATTVGKLVVSYSAAVVGNTDNSTNLNFGIAMWDVNETADNAADLSNPVVLWSDESVVWAPSALAYDSATSSLYVAVGGNVTNMNQTTGNYGYNIEKFVLDLATPSLTRVSINHKPFIQGTSQTKCVSHMIVAE